MSQLNHFILSPHSAPGPRATHRGSHDLDSGLRPSPLLTNFVPPFRMVSNLGKRTAQVGSAELEVDFKEQTSARRKPDEELCIQDKTKPSPILAQ